MASSENGKPKLRRGDPGYVGRGVPPTHSRIQPGEVRNPWGRRGKARANHPPTDFSEQIADLLCTPIPAKDGKSVTPVELGLLRLFNRMNAGDISAIKYFFELSEKYVPKPPEGEAAALIEMRRDQLVRDALARREAKDVFLREGRSDEEGRAVDGAEESGPENSGN